jgi:hypothetical protein
MTEEKWLSACDLEALIKYLEDKTSERKLRLYSCACARLVQRLFPNERCETAVQVAERFADRMVGASELLGHWQIAHDITARLNNSYLHRRDPTQKVAWAAANAARYTLEEAALECAEVNCQTYFIYPYELPQWEALWPRKSEEYYLNCLYDIFGNPFRLVAIDPDWRTSNVVSLAKDMYESRDFTAMPILSDALQDAGCENADILDHCRGPGPHVRGCWVVDLLLGKA